MESQTLIYLNRVLTNKHPGRRDEHGNFHRSSTKLG